MIEPGTRSFFQHAFRTKLNVARTPDQFAASFWARVQKIETCWLWTGPVHPKGYGLVNRLGQTLKSHRVAFELEFGPTSLHVLHKCDVRNCVRPDHLFAGTNRDNVYDALAKGRRHGVPLDATACTRGHAYTPETTYWKPDGRRSCKVCKRENDLRNRKVVSAHVCATMDSRGAWPLKCVTCGRFIKREPLQSHKGDADTNGRTTD